MGFVQLECWDARRCASPVAAGDRPEAKAAALLLLSPERLPRRVTAVLVSVSVHLVLLWLFGSRIAAGLEVDAARPGPATTIISLADVRPPDSSSPGEAQAASPAPPVPSSKKAEMEVTAPSELPPPEWSISGLQQTAQLPAKPSEAAQALAAGGAEGSQGGAYDPYAGAVPLRDRDEVQGGRSGISELDVAALAALRRAFSRSISPAEGTVDTSVHVSATGVVTSATVTGGTAPLQVKEKWRRLLIGKRLFKSGSVRSVEQDVSLPTQRFER